VIEKTSEIIFAVIARFTAKYYTIFRFPLIKNRVHFLGKMGAHEVRNNISFPNILKLTAIHGTPNHMPHINLLDLVTMPRISM
jgi:hypothetical protein